MFLIAVVGGVGYQFDVVLNKNIKFERDTMCCCFLLKYRRRYPEGDFMQTVRWSNP